jgi:hypothetical protein
MVMRASYQSDLVNNRIETVNNSRNTLKDQVGAKE